ncbi:MAG: hypothetical protein JW702_03505 [Clostridiales bacterium]|nr:hypothetical protein [Clostridiales bacterium]
MAKNEVYYTLEILPANIILVRFKDNFIISKNNFISILEIVRDRFFEYPIVIDITNIDGIDYDAIDLNKVTIFNQYPCRIALIYNSKNISKKYADLIKNVNKSCKHFSKFDKIEEAVIWAREISVS